MAGEGLAHALQSWGGVVRQHDPAPVFSGFYYNRRSSSRTGPSARPCEVRHGYKQGHRMTLGVPIADPCRTSSVSTSRLPGRRDRDCRPRSTARKYSN